jgi:UDP-N-acetylmuramate dehydrogenase
MSTTQHPSPADVSTGQEVDMPLPAAAAAALREVGVPFEEDTPLARRVWWRVGGPADALIEARSTADVAAAAAVAAAHGLALHVLGNGSNLLVSDDGVAGLVLHLGALDHARLDADQLLSVGAGLRDAVLLARAAKHGWAGLDALAGIPGTVGGAVRMNAGSSLGELGDTLVDVDVVLPGGAAATLPAAALDLGYRRCQLPPGAVVTAARLRLADPATFDAGQERVRAFLALRKATQPLDLPSCGSTFRNPPGDYAGRLIEAAGLKGFTVGGAQVSPKHANFVVNLGDATAADIAAVIRRARDVVADRFGVTLRPEVEALGRGPAPW